MSGIYATGTSGLIGSKLVDVRPLQIDLQKPVSFKTVAKEMSCVIHLAGVVSERRVQQEFTNAYRINVTGTIKFARHILNYSDSRFVFVSSSHVYKPSGEMHSELDTIAPVNLYGLLKWEAEVALQDIFKFAPERLCIARVFSVLDIGMPYGSLGWAIENVKSSSPLRNGSDIRDFLTPRSIATHLRTIAQQEFIFPIVNVCSGRSMTIIEACMKLRNSLGLETPQEFIDAGNSAVPCIAGDNSRLLWLQ